MAVVTDADKNNMISQAQGYAATLLDTIARVKLLRQEAIDKGYNPGGADGLTDAFLQTTPGKFPNLSAADVTAFFTAVNDMDALLGNTTVAAGTGSGRTDYKSLEKMRPVNS